MRFSTLLRMLLPGICCLLFWAPVFAQPNLVYTPVISRLGRPVDIVFANDGSNRIFVVVKNGNILVFDKAYTNLGIFLAASGINAQGEGGLLSLAFHPSFKTNGKFFTYHTNTNGDIEIAQYQVSQNPNIADKATKKIIITIPHPTNANHNGGKLQFGRDGYLYFATGDGGGSGDRNNNAQNGQSLLGKILRIDIDRATPPLNYSIPDDNPYITDPAIADEIWAIGLRNPWRWSFDRLTQDIWVADVGQGKWEEINFSKSGGKGANYGWRCFEGNATFNTSNCQLPGQFTPPVFAYPHNALTGGFAVTGGFVYRGAKYPSLYGNYLCADYSSGNQWRIRDSSGSWAVTQVPGTYPKGITAFGEDDKGELYACSYADGKLYKLEVSTGVSIEYSNFSGQERNDIVDLSWSVRETNIQSYQVEKSMDSLNFQPTGSIVASKGDGEREYAFRDSVQGMQVIYYRIRVLNNTGQWDYSNTIKITNDDSGDIKFDLLSFQAMLDKDSVLLEWSARESNISGYKIERSSDSLNFTAWDSLEAINNKDINLYSRRDRALINIKTFYRLGIVDVTGNVRRSPVISFYYNPPPDILFYLEDFKGTLRQHLAELKWSAREVNMLRYEIEGSNDSTNFLLKNIVLPKNQAGVNDYTFSEQIPGQSYFYRLKAINITGQFEYSNVINLVDPTRQDIFVYPSFITNKIITTYIPPGFKYFRIYKTSGEMVLQKDIERVSGRLDIPIPQVMGGVYIVKLWQSQKELVQKVVVSN